MLRILLVVTLALDCDAVPTRSTNKLARRLAKLDEENVNMKIATLSAENKELVASIDHEEGLGKQLHLSASSYEPYLNPVGKNGVRNSQVSHECVDDAKYKDFKWGYTCQEWGNWIEQSPSTRSCRDPAIRKRDDDDDYSSGWVEIESNCPAACGCGEGKCAYWNGGLASPSTAPCGKYECQSYLKDHSDTGSKLAWRDCCRGSMPSYKTPAVQTRRWVPEVKMACEANATRFAALLSKNSNDCQKVADSCLAAMVKGIAFGNFDFGACKLAAFPPIWGKSGICAMKKRYHAWTGDELPFSPHIYDATCPDLPRGRCDFEKDKP